MVKARRSIRGHFNGKECQVIHLKDKYTKFTIKDDESVPKMFHRLNMIVTELRALGHKVYDEDFSHKFLRCLPPRFDTLVTILARSGLDTMTPNQVLGDVIT